MDPRAYLRLMEKEWQLASVLYSSCNGELLDYPSVINLIRSHKSSDLKEQQLLDKLLDADILIQPLASETRYQLSGLANSIVSELLQVQQLGISDNIRGYIEHIDKESHSILDGAANNDPHQVNQGYKRLTQMISNISHQLRNNLSAIQHLCGQAKQVDGVMPVAQRYSEVIHAWDTYIVPIGEMIDIHGVFKEHLELAQQALSESLEILHNNSPHRSDLERIQNLRFQIVGLKSGLLNSYQVSRDTLYPLYEVARRNSHLSRGAATIIDALRKQIFSGIEGSVVAAMYIKPRQSLLGTQSALSQFAMVFLNASNRTPPTIKKPSEKPDLPGLMRPPCDFGAAVGHLKANLPMDDVMEWILEEYKDEPVGVALDLLLLVKVDKSLAAEGTRQRNTYLTATHEIEASVISVKERIE